MMAVGSTPHTGDPSLLIITPAHNEADHIASVIEAVAAQTRRPDKWIIVNDASTDETGEIVDRLAADLPFVEVIHNPPLKAGDRLAEALEARAFNQALKSVPNSTFTHIGKLDADIVLPPEWFEVILDAFTPTTGIVGGRISEHGEIVASAPNHVHGAVKVYAADCLAAIGGMQEQLGWDHADEVHARMRGFETVVAPDITAKHLRPVGSAQGRLRGRARHGACSYIGYQPFWWALLRAAKMGLRESPRVLGGAAFIAGYIQAALRRAERSGGRDYRDFARAEIRGRLTRTS